MPVVSEVLVVPLVSGVPVALVLLEVPVVSEVLVAPEGPVVPEVLVVSGVPVARLCRTVRVLYGGTFPHMLLLINKQYFPFIFLIRSFLQTLD